MISNGEQHNFYLPALTPCSFVRIQIRQPEVLMS
jgi:hypothetical protein